MRRGRRGRRNARSTARRSCLRLLSTGGRRPTSRPHPILATRPRFNRRLDPSSTASGRARRTRTTSCARRWRGWRTGSRRGNRRRAGRSSSSVIVDALNAGDAPEVRMLGSVGQADLARERRPRGSPSSRASSSYAGGSPSSTTTRSPPATRRSPSPTCAGSVRRARGCRRPRARGLLGERDRSCIPPLPSRVPTRGSPRASTAARAARGELPLGRGRRSQPAGPAELSHATRRCTEPSRDALSLPASARSSDRAQRVRRRTRSSLFSRGAARLGRELRRAAARGDGSTSSASRWLPRSTSACERSVEAPPGNADRPPGRPRRTIQTFGST